MGPLVGERGGGSRPKGKQKKDNEADRRSAGGKTELAAGLGLHLKMKEGKSERENSCGTRRSQCGKGRKYQKNFKVTPQRSRRVR